jgi:ArsR family transcriptional regulator
MGIYQAQARLFKVLMHPTRLAILDVLRNGEQCVCHMEAVFGLRQAHISQHLMVLRDAELVTDRRDGWNIFYRVNKPEIYTVIDAMNVFSGEAGGKPGIETQSSDASFNEMRACPCPKCNPAAEMMTKEAFVPVLDRIETMS